jgi:hypothetical protein
MQPQRNKRHAPLPPTQRVCEHCGQLFIVYHADLRRGHSRFCGNACHIAHRYGSIEQRFWKKVDQTSNPDGCWLWTGWHDAAGYGEMSIPGTGRNTKAHRVAYLLTKGPIPDGLLVLHRCDNPPCVRPGHLFLGTQGDNARDREAKGRGRQPRGERTGRAKLDATRVSAIRARYASGTASQPQLAREYGVSTSLISLIVRREAWRHIS